MKLVAVLKTFGIEKCVPALAIAEPHVQTAIAIAVVGLAKESPMCGAKEIAMMAAIGAMLYANNSDQADGAKA
jgi:hypothetical protein